MNFPVLAAFLAFLLGSCQSSEDIKTVPVEEFAQYITQPDVQLLDVRTPEEYAEGHLDGAVLIDFKADGFVEKAEAQLKKDQPVALYCRGGRRSHMAAEQMLKAGFTRLTELKDGITAWNQADMPVVTSETPYVIEGELTGMKDGLVISLMQMDGSVGTRIASDTLHNGKFRFEQVMQEPELNLVTLMCNDDAFPSMSCDVYIAPGAHIEVKGHNAHIYSWDVQSNVQEQKERNRLLQTAAAEYEGFQDVSTERKLVIKELSGIDRKSDKEHYAKAYERYKAIGEKSDSISDIIQRKKVELMKKMEPSQPWLRELGSMAKMAGAYQDYAFKDDAVALYESLPAEIKQSVKGMEIRANLYPPQKVNDGDECPDADMYDLEGNVHRLSEHKGKYILLDFWSSGCGPCIKAFPEMKQMSEQYADRLAIVSMSTDTERRWRKASAQHDITWSNWNEGKGTGGLYSYFQIIGIPYYVLVNPEGKVERQLLGYREGTFKALFSELFE